MFNAKSPIQEQRMSYHSLKSTFVSFRRSDMSMIICTSLLAVHLPQPLCTHVLVSALTDRSHSDCKAGSLQRTYEVFFFNL